jgi:four helix bundle protein
MFNFEKLEVWQLARKITSDIYSLTDTFPVHEKFILVSQIRRAALSIVSNIAEGSTRISPKDQAHFTTMAFSSLMELINHLIISTDIGIMSENDLDNFKVRFKKLTIKLSNLKATQLKRIS